MHLWSGSRLHKVTDDRPLQYHMADGSILKSRFHPGALPEVSRKAPVLSDQTACVRPEHPLWLFQSREWLIEKWQSKWWTDLQTRNLFKLRIGPCPCFQAEPNAPWVWTIYRRTLLFYTRYDCWWRLRLMVATVEAWVRIYYSSCSQSPPGERHPQSEEVQKRLYFP